MNSPSPFAQALSALFFETNCFNRDQWVDFLGTTRAKIAEWLSDKSLPRPDQLWMAIQALKRTSDILVEPVEAFEVMAAKRATEVSPLGEQMLPTVQEYMSRIAFSELANRLAKLDPEDRVKLLKDLYPEPEK